MWEPWPPKKGKNPPNRTARNLSNLRVIETNVTNSKSFKDKSRTESSLYMQEHFSVPMQKSSLNFSNSSQYSKSNFSHKPSQSSALSSKLKHKYFYTHGSYDQHSSQFASDNNDSHLHYERVNNMNSKFPRKDFRQPNYYQRYSKAQRNKRKREKHKNSKPSSLPAEDKTVYKSDADELNEFQQKVQSSDLNEDCFEEVEVASYETEECQQEVPVSFRKTKVHYLKYKKNCFYKPKVYNIAQHRMTVTCLSSTKEKVIDSTEGKDDQDEIDDLDQEIIDVADEDSNETVVAEASGQNEVVESNTPMEVTKNVSQNQDIKGSTIQDELKKGSTIQDEVKKGSTSQGKVTDSGSSQDKVPEGGSQQGEAKGSTHSEVMKGGIQKEKKSSSQNEVTKGNIQNEVTKSNVQNEATKGSIRSSVTEENEKIGRDIQKETTKDIIRDKVDVQNKAEAGKVDGKVKTGKAHNNKAEVKNISKKSEKEIEVIELTDDEDNVVDSSAKESCKSSTQTNEKLPPTASRVYKKCDDKSSIYQGKSLIHNILDSCRSHLIGIEYLIEVQDKMGSSVVNHYCALCCENLPFEKFKPNAVLSHINDYSHIVKYLEMHFPTYFFRDNKGCDNLVTLKKVCEKINRENGYYYMCITNLDTFVECKETLKSILDSVKLSAKLANIDDNFLEKTFESVLQEDVKRTIGVILNKISQEEQAVQDNKKLKSMILATKGTAVTSFLKLELASSFSKSFKGSKARAANVSSASLSSMKSSKAKSTPPGVSSATSLSPMKSSKTRGRHENASVSCVKDVSHEVAGAKSSALQVSPAKDPEGEESEDIEILSEHSVENSLKDEPNVIKRKVVTKGKEKSTSKLSLHSKHCPKRMLSKENSRLTAKTSLNNELTNDVPLKNSSKHKLVVKSSDISVSKGVYEKKDLKKDIKKSTSIKVFDCKHKQIQIRNVNSIKQLSPVSSSKDTSPYRKVNIKVESLQDIEITGETSRKIPSRSDTSRKRSASPYKRIVRRLSKSPARRIITSPIRLSPARRITSPIRLSPTRRITSPIRVSPVRRRSKSPLRMHPLSFEKVHSRNSGRRFRDSIKRQIRSPIRNPVRRYSRSPVRKRYERRHSRSPIRRHSRSPVRRHSRSPVRKDSRSPARRYSRSPRRYSRSPLRRHSRSPVRKRSRSPIRRHSRSPVRNYVRSPLRRHSRSPLRRHSKSPLRRLSRSPDSRRSRSSENLYPRSPVGKKSRSPYDRDSRSPVGHRSSSRQSISSSDRHSSTLEKYKNTFRAVSPYEDRVSKSSGDTFGQYSHSKSPLRMSGKHSSRYESSKHKVGRLSPSSISDNFIPFLNTLSSLDIDLDPVSDEDESNYFNTTDERHSSDGKMSTQKAVLADFLKKFSMADVSPNDTTVNKFMQFMQAHSSEIQELMGSRSGAKSAKMLSGSNPTSISNQSLYLQQCLFQSLAGKREPMPSNVPFSSGSNVATSFGQQPFLPNQPKFGHPPVIPGLDHVQPSQTQAKLFPPNLNVPPPNRFSFANQKPSVLPPKPRVPSEIMFKDLKATVSKLFGPNSSARVQEAKPGFVTEQDPKFHLSHPDAPNLSAGQKNVFNPLSQSFNSQSIPGIRDEIPQQYNHNQFFSGRADVEQARPPNVPIPPPNAKVSFCDSPAGSVRGNIFPVVNRPQGAAGMSLQGPRGSVSDVKVSLAQRLASVLVKVGMIDVPAPLLQEMLMKIGAFSASPPQDITEAEILTILKRLGYL